MDLPAAMPCNDAWVVVSGLKLSLAKKVLISDENCLAASPSCQSQSTRTSNSQIDSLRVLELWSAQQAHDDRHRLFDQMARKP
jgi:hypothetical protein